MNHSRRWSSLGSTLIALILMAAPCLQARAATDFVEKMWPLDYGHNGSKKFPYPSEGAFPIASPAHGSLWDRAREAGVTFRSYG